MGESSPTDLPSARRFFLLLFQPTFYFIGRHRLILSSGEGVVLLSKVVQERGGFGLSQIQVRIMNFFYLFKDSEKGLNKNFRIFCSDNDVTSYNISEFPCKVRHKTI